ncbi:hypothetical protein FQN57_004986 [Myotisia sp. PD_48]|nr:hypothetical protein FQN57_004986 [Myotisia sp. PD_48]
MSERFGAAFENLSSRIKGPGSSFMQDFEQVKQSFGHTYAEEVYEIPLDMRISDPDPNYFDEDERLVLLSGQDMETIFDPTVSQIITLVEAQMEATESQAIRKLAERLIADTDLQILVPQYPQAAIVGGAALRGLEGIFPTSRRSRRHFGQEINLPFREGIGAEKDGYFDPFDGEKFCRNRIEWVIEKGEKLAGNTTRKFSLKISGYKEQLLSTVVKLYSCNLDSAPERCDHPSLWIPLKHDDLLIIQSDGLLY